jgi:formate hydrogenlyase transcriptional activator
VEQVAPTDSTVLLYGETGTGKELVARAIHNRSSRNGRALVSVNCSAISAGLVESELFGHVKGAFTGALERRIGRFELANGGTIFLDEIGELCLETQVKLLRVLQEHEFEPVGSSHPLRVDVRVIAATNRNLLEAVQAGRFRSDLFYRLNVFPIELPPLRERRSDIPQLVAFCLSEFSKRLGKKIDGVSGESMENLVNYPWPGNIRELQNVIERAIIVSAGPTLRLDRDLMPVATAAKGIEAPETDAPEGRQADLKSPKPLLTLDEVERNHILAALQHADGVVDGPKGAARILNLHANTLRHRMDKLGIKVSRHRQS